MVFSVDASKRLGRTQSGDGKNVWVGHTGGWRYTDDLGYQLMVTVPPHSVNAVPPSMALPVKNYQKILMSMKEDPKDWVIAGKPYTVAGENLVTVIKKNYLLMSKKNQ